MQGRVLLIDDDTDLTDLLGDYLGTEGFAVQVAADGTRGTEIALSGAVDLVVLDCMLPGRSGLECLAAIRTASSIPVLMLTGRGDAIERVHGLELGADDYVPKPCTPRELVARIRAILKRVRPAAGAAAALAIDDLALRPGERRAELRGVPLRLTSTEFSLLEVLMREAGHVVVKERLSEEALGRPLARFDRSIDMHISSLRHKLGPRPDGRSWIETVVRRGYQFLKA